MNAIISLREVTKRFRETVALDKVTVDFEAGKIHGIVGRNGSGKTVLMKCVCGLMHQDAGEILVRGQRVGKDVDIPQGIGAIIEAPGFLPNFSGYRILKFLAVIRGLVVKERGGCALDPARVDPDSPKHVGKYSLGMRQRLGLAQAILEDPDLLILDEPMNGLDKRGVEEMRRLLLGLRQEGKTILLASHSSEDIALLCDTVHEMDGGRLQQ